MEPCKHEWLYRPGGDVSVDTAIKLGYCKDIPWTYKSDLPHAVCIAGFYFCTKGCKTILTHAEYQYLTRP